jgi:transposase InsO family protein
MTPDGQIANPLDKAANREPSLERFAKPKQKVMIHSDQGSLFTSTE